MVILDTVQVIGWENIELISDRPLETMLDEFKRLKQEYPDRRAFFMHKCSIRGIMACLPEHEIMSFSMRILANQSPDPFLRRWELASRCMGERPDAFEIKVIVC